MARMIPSSPPRDNPSRAENRLFLRIRDELSNSWVALHSLGLGNHRLKPWAEVDFVLIGPLGVFCIEVKGGRVARQAGEWLFTDRNGAERTKREGPFEQAGGASTALFKYLSEKIPEIRNSVVGFGVATPDLTFNINGPDITVELVYDERNISSGFGRYLDRVAAYWNKRLRGSRVQQPLDARVCERILEQLRPDFDLIPSLRSQIGVVRDELCRLTNEQYRVVDALSENPRIMIRGGAGPGKSLLALRETRRIAQGGGRVLLCCFNRLLAQYLRSMLLDCVTATVIHLHGFMADVVAQAGLTDRLPAAEPTDLFDVYYPQLCVEALLDEVEYQYDAIVIDEGQDLLKQGYLDIFDVLLRGGLKRGIWRLFYDPNQDIYKGLKKAPFSSLDRGGPAQFRLFTNCRNTLPIATATGLLTTTVCVETLTINGPDVKMHWYVTPGQQIRQISNHLNQLLSSGLTPGEIVILSKRKLRNSVLGLGLLGVSVPLCDMTMTSSQESNRQHLHFSTIAAFKGLESEAVILADIDDLTSEDARELLYVGTSRARTLLSLFFSELVRPQYTACGLRYGELIARSTN